FINDHILTKFSVRVSSDEPLENFDYELRVTDKSFNDSWLFTTIEPSGNNSLVVTLHPAFDLAINESPLLYQLVAIDSNENDILLNCGRMYVNDLITVLSN